MTDGVQSDQRHRAVRRVLAITLGINACVALVKLGYGYAFDIISLQADGFHSIFDGLSNVIGLVALSIARHPPDPEHPYGHQKLEVAASIVIGMLVLLGLIEVGRGIYEAAGSGSGPTIHASAYVVIIATIFINLGISFYERRQGERWNSMILKSDSAHTFSDSLAALAVLVGVYLVDLGIGVGDIIAAVVVMTFIGMTAYRVLREGISVIVDTAFLDAELVQSVVQAHPEVRSCHYVRSRGMPGHIHLEFHMSLDPDLTLTQAGEIMLAVKNELHRRFTELEDIVIQLEPHARPHLDDVPEKLV